MAGRRSRTTTSFRWVLTAVLLPSFFALPVLAQATLQITAPADGAVVNPGQTLTVTISASPVGAFTSVVVIGWNPLGLNPALPGPPYQASVPIPSNTTPGRYLLTASGTTTAGDSFYSSPIAIDVERPDYPTTLRVEPSELIMEIGDVNPPLRVVGVFADGAETDLTHSSRSAYYSNSPSVATIDAKGVVTAVAQGSANITVSNGPNASSFVPVTVVPPIRINPLPPPTLTSMSPAVGGQGAKVHVTLAGTYFVSGATIAIDNPGVSVSGLTIVSSTQITADFIIAADAALGAANVTVTTSGGTSGAAVFTVN